MLRRLQLPHSINQLNMATPRAAIILCTHRLLLLRNSKPCAHHISTAPGGMACYAYTVSGQDVVHMCTLLKGLNLWWLIIGSIKHVWDKLSDAQVSLIGWPWIWNRRVNATWGEINDEEGRKWVRKPSGWLTRYQLGLRVEAEIWQETVGWKEIEGSKKLTKFKKEFSFQQTNVQWS